jgi:hypothetical protein
MSLGLTRAIASGAAKLIARSIAKNLRKRDRLIKSTKYIPKQLLLQVQKLEQEKAPVREILKVLGVME